MDETVDTPSDDLQALMDEAAEISAKENPTEEDAARLDEIQSQIQAIQENADRKAEMSKKFASMKKSFAVHSKSPAPRMTPSVRNVAKSDLQVEVEKRGFNYAKAAHAYLEGKTLRGFEGEYNQELSLKQGESKRHFYAPRYVDAKYALNTTTGAGGIPTQFVDGQINLLRANSILDKIGATIVEGLTEPTSYIVQTSDPAFAWVTDGADGTDTNPTYTTVTLTPHNGIATVPVTRKFLKSSPNANDYVVQQMLKRCGLGVDLAWQSGDGTGGAPEGILSNSDVLANTVTFGGAPTWANIVALESTVAQLNGETGVGGYVTNPKVRGKLKTIAKEAGAALGFLMELDGTVNGHPCYITSQIPSTLGTSPSNNKSAILYSGDWSGLYVGFFGSESLDVLIDEYSLSKSGGVRLNVYVDMDVKIPQPNQFSVALDVDA